MKLTVINPIGYCAGVTNAINIALKARENNPNKLIFVIGMLVHNEQVVKLLSSKNITTLYRDKQTDEKLIKSIPENSIVIFSAHGHDYKLDKLCESRKLKVLDTTCPKVKHNIDIINKEIKDGHQVIYIGHNKHPEALAALAISNDVIFYETKLGTKYSLIKDDSPIVINQTTLNTMELVNIHNEIKSHIPNARFEDEICNTTRLRQEGIKNLPDDVDLIIIIGDSNSSNTKRLFEIANTVHNNTLSILVSSLDDLDKSVLENKKHIAIASGASTPSETINDMINFIKNY